LAAAHELLATSVREGDSGAVRLLERSLGRVVQLAGGPNQTPVAPSYIPAANLATGSLAWDSGDDDLPGPY